MGHKQDSTYIVVPKDLKERFKAWADREGRTMVGHVKYLVDKADKKK